MKNLFRTPQELDDDELNIEVKAAGATPISQVEQRQPVFLMGRLDRVTMSAGSQAPKLVAELRDGTGSILLVWMGRRQIAGINPGIKLRVKGTVVEHHNELVIFNPDYELL